MARGARLGRGRPNRPVILRARVAPRSVRPVILVVIPPVALRALRKGTRTVLRAPQTPSGTFTQVRYFIDELAAKWVFQMVSVERVSALSKARVNLSVRADADGLPYDPTHATPEMAFMSSPLTEPSSGDWKTATWDVTRIGSYIMQCLVGPGGTVTLPRGGYYVWARITDPVAGEIPVESVARLFVD
jgi:hypothetical protein